MLLKSCSISYAGKRKGKQCSLCNVCKTSLKIFLSRQCSLTHMHLISWTKNLVNLRNLIKIGYILHPHNNINFLIREIKQPLFFPSTNITF